MGSLCRAVALSNAKTGGRAKVEFSTVYGNITLDKEWSKWLKYESTNEKNRIEYLTGKEISSLTSEEINELNRYKKYRYYRKLFTLYENNRCNEEEYMKVYDFMCKENLEAFMLSKLSIDELNYAKNTLEYLLKLRKNEIVKIIKEERLIENYKTLSMADAYILHIVTGGNMMNSFENLNTCIHTKIKH